jgi:hypothetical protein
MMKIQRTLLLAGSLVGTAAATAVAEGNMIITTGGQMRIQLDGPIVTPVDQTTPVTAGRIEIAKVRNLPPWGAEFSLNHLSLSFADFDISRLGSTHHFHAAGMHLRGAVSFAAFEVPAGVFTFSIPRDAVTVYGGTMVGSDLHAGEERPTEDVTGTINLNTNTFQARVVVHKEGEVLPYVTVGGPLTIDLWGTVQRQGNPAEPPPGDFRITCAPSTINLQNGNTGTCTVHSESAFSQAVQLSCDGLYQFGAYCQFNPPTVMPSPDGTVTTTMTVVGGGAIPPGTFTFRPYAYRGTVVRMTTVQLIAGATAAGDLTAAYDATLQAPACSTLIGRSCYSVALATSRGLRETNYPNTVNRSCDESRGHWRFLPTHFVHDIKVSTLDGAPLERHKDVRIDATVVSMEEPWAHEVDFFYAGDASNPTWVLMGSQPIYYADFETVSATYRLPAGGTRQAVRVQIRYRSDAAGPCSPSPNADRDDLVFSVSAAPIA